MGLTTDSISTNLVEENKTDFGTENDDDADDADTDGININNTDNDND